VNYDTIKDLVCQNLSSREIADKLSISQTTVRYWLKKHNLKTIKKETDGFKVCPQCNYNKEIASSYYVSKSGHVHAWCKDCNDTITYQKQLIRKKECVEYKGGKCVICGYNKYVGALDFHHLNPNEKEYSISNLRTYSMAKVKIELDKCVLLCRNCHAEVHNGLIKL